MNYNTIIKMIVRKMKISLLLLLTTGFLLHANAQTTFDGIINEPRWQQLATQSGGPGPGFGAGHEVNAIYAFSTPGQFGFAIAGNVQNNNRILLLIDSRAGGYISGNFGRTAAPQGIDDFNSGTTFDAGFAPDYCMVIGTNGAGNYFFDLFTLSGTAGSGGGPNNYLGDSAPGGSGSNESRLGASPANANNTRGFEVVIDRTLVGADASTSTIQLMAMYISDGGFLSNQFLTRANAGEGNYGNGAVTFGAAAPNPISVDVNTPPVLPVTFTAFNAVIENEKVKLNWTAEETPHLSHYEVEESFNATSFVKMHQLERSNTLSNRGAVYTVYDKELKKGANYYRIVAVGFDGERKYSTIARINFGNVAKSLTVLQTPGTNALNVIMSGIEKGSYHLGIFNNNGQLVYSRNIVHDGNNSSQIIYLNSSNTGNLFRVILRGESGVYTQTILK